MFIAISSHLCTTWNGTGFANVSEIFAVSIIRFVKAEAARPPRASVNTTHIYLVQNLTAKYHCNLQLSTFFSQKIKESANAEVINKLGSVTMFNKLECVAETCSMHGNDGILIMKTEAEEPL